MVLLGNFSPASYEAGVQFGVGIVCEFSFPLKNQHFYRFFFDIFEVPKIANWAHTFEDGSIKKCTFRPEYGVFIGE